MARKISTDIPGRCSEAVRTPLEVNGNSQRPQGPMGMVHEEGHGYLISLQIWRCIQRIGMGLTDDKVASRTRRFLMDQTLYKGQQVWVPRMDGTFCS